jgi:hypothetical protein
MPTARHAAPALTTRFAPKRSYSGPAANEIAANTPISGNSPAPACSGSHPRIFCMNWGR